MSHFKIFVKPTSGGEKISLEVSGTMTVQELKEAVSDASNIPALEQRLIYKGQVLKAERTVESYGIQEEHVLHMVKSKPPSTESGAGAQQSGQAAPQAAALFGTGAQPPSTGQQQMLSNLLNLPQVQSMLQNPEVLRTMLNSNPAIRQLMNSNPEMAHVLNNPQLLRESLNLAANPALLREQMRHSDRAMSNLEAHPEGFNALRRMYENIHEPLQNAAQGENVAPSNPFAALLQSQQPSADSAQAGNGPSDSLPASTAPNTAPLPNPWAPNAGSGAASNPATASAPPSGNPPDLGSLAAMGMLPGLGGSGGGAAPSLDSPQSQEAMLQMLNDPTYRQAMSEFMTSEYGHQAVRNMAESNPQLRQMLDSNPMLRDLFNDPERLRRMLSPESVQALMGLRQNMEQLDSVFGAGARGNAGGAASLGPGLDANALASLLSGELGGLGGAAPRVTNPEEAYATQLAQLQEMGFFDRELNIEALQTTGGNVQAAVDRLLNHSY